MPYPDFVKSAQCLDNKRLGKQRVECLQILKALTIPDYGWKNHPIVKMWKGYESLLCIYGIKMSEEWIKRGYRDTMLNRYNSPLITNEEVIVLSKHIEPYPVLYPFWFGNKSFHLSHQSNLLRKDYAHYSKFFIDVPNDLPYQWYNPETKLFYTTK
ncbi:MAG: hypothetical protein UR43_C0033G0005 [candidate division TM6 bacterium GW2011_GWF2_33_332]|nr:MAG: hypothetical protein UR43_C0033G0005 [candidate division TM6 bacterium GW2011_GWF2_33_332]